MKAVFRDNAPGRPRSSGPLAFLAAFLALGLSLPSSEAAAQSSGPLRLIPPKTRKAPDARTAPDVRTAPKGSVTRDLSPRTGGTVTQPRQAPAPSAAGTTRETRPAASASGVEIRSLAILDAASVGVLGPDDGGFGPRLWAGSSRPVVAALLGRLPARQVSPVLQSLQRRLLLTAAGLPGGKGPDLLALRLANLRALGWSEDLQRLLGAVPANTRNGSGEVAWIALEGELLAGRTEAACQIARERSARDDDRRWQAALATCAALAGDVGRLDLHESLLLESGPADGDLSDLLHHVVQGKAASRKLRLRGEGEAGTLSLALLREARQAPPETWSTALNGPSAVWLSRMTHLEPDLRNRARLWLVRNGALPASSMVDADLPAPSAAGENDLPVRLHALTGGAAVPVADLATLFVESREAGLLPQAIELAATHLRRPIDSGVEAEVADEMVRANLLAGDLPRARGWLRVDGVVDRTPALALADLNSTVWFKPQSLQRWWRQQETRGQVAAGGFERPVALLSALDFPVPQSVHTALLAADAPSAHQAVSASLLRQLEAASADVRLGETLLVILVAVGERPVGALASDHLARLVAALNRVGLEQEARALAVEALLGGDG